MSGLQIACAKGCGVPITVDQETIEEAMKNNAPLVVAHDVCPRDAKHFPKYRVVIAVYKHEWTNAGDAPDSEGAYEEEGELLTTVGGETIAPTFVDGFEKITKAISEQWESVAKVRNVVEG